MNQVAAIVVKELKVLLRDRQALILLFAMPTFFILVMSVALEGVFEAGSKRRPIEVLVINEDDGAISRKAIADLKRLEGIVLVETINGGPLKLDTSEEYIRRGSYPLVLFFKAGFSERVLHPDDEAGKQEATVHFINDPATNAQLLAGLKGAIEGVIMRHAFLETLGQRLETAAAKLAENLNVDLDRYIPREGNPAANPLPGMPMNIGENPNIIFASSPPRGFRADRFPTATEQNIPAYTIFGVFFIVLTLASSIVQEKKDGTFQRILASPLSKSALLLGKLLPYYLVNLIQIALMFAIGIIVFGMKLGSIPALILVSLAVAATANGMGLMVAALGKTETQVNAWSVLLAITLSAMGGMLVPTFVMPELMRSLSLCTPHSWALQGYHDVIVRGLGLQEVLPEVAVLLGFAGAFFCVALIRFRFD